MKLLLLNLHARKALYKICVNVFRLLILEKEGNGTRDGKGRRLCHHCNFTSKICLNNYVEMVLLWSKVKIIYIGRGGRSASVPDA